MTVTEKDPCLNACDSLSYCVNTTGSPRCQRKAGFIMRRGRCVGRFDFLFDINKAPKKSTTQGILKCPFVTMYRYKANLLNVLIK